MTSKDAARFINTLDETAPPSEQPDSADFAILDLAADNDLLRRIYAGMTHEAISWRSLFENTDWFEQWEHGPILVDLRQCPAFRAALFGQMNQLPMGLLLETSWDMDSLHDHISRWIHKGLSNDGQLMRLHEPRMFGPLLCIMDDMQYRALTAAGSRWIWHDTHTWRSTTLDQPQPPAELSDIPRLPESKLEETKPYWLAAEAHGYSTHYRDALPNQTVPTHWVLERLLEGSTHGFHQSSHLERWLRLSIQYDADFHSRAPYKTILSDQHKTLSDRLSAMESASENQHAPV